MTNIDYEKAYNEALNRAKLLKYNPQKVLFECENIPVSDYIFPELKESKSERIKKVLVDYFKRYKGQEKRGGSTMFCGIPTDDILEWIEKQDKSAEINPDEIIEECHQDNADHIIDIVTAQEKPSEWGKEDENEFNHILKILNLVAKEQENKGYNNLISSANWLKSIKDRIQSKPRKKNIEQNLAKKYGITGIGSKHAEGKLGEMIKKKIETENVDNTNKVEPKFHENEWVVLSNHNNKDAVYRVEDNKNYRYILRHILGGPRYLSCNSENMLRRWTIDDAKAGDILISSENKPFIYNGYFNEYFVGAYCGIDIYNEFIVTDEQCDWTMNKGIRPATKKQRGILFQKMNDAGYKWDTAKKELINIL